MLRYAAIAMIFALGPIAAGAGTTGMIAGRVCDETGHRPVPNALVTAYSPAQVESVRTDSLGRYRFISLVPGLYIVGTNVQPPGGPALCIYASADGATRVDLPFSPSVHRDYACVRSPQIVQPGTTADVYDIF